MKELFTSISFCLLVQIGCFGQFTSYGWLDSELNECSGFEIAWNQIYAHNDSGDSTRIFKLDQYGSLIEQTYPNSLVNKDWEDCTISSDGSVLYIADVGSNNFLFNREFRTIYKIPLDNGNLGTDIDSITFKFEDYGQSADISYFDCEAIFYHNDKIYLFTKNYYTPSGYSRLYSLNINDSLQEAVLLDSVLTEFRVTAADAYLDEVCILTEGKVLRGFISEEQTFETVENYPIPFAKYEAICYRNSNNVILAKDTEGLEIFNLQLRDTTSFELSNVFINDAAEIIIQPTDELTLGLIYCRLYDVQGHLLKEGEFSNCCGYYRIDVSALDQSVILLQLETKDNITVHKLVK